MQTLPLVGGAGSDLPLPVPRMESTEKCDAIIQHFNGKFIKTPPGVPGESPPPGFSWCVVGV